MPSALCGGVSGLTPQSADGQHVGQIIGFLLFVFTEAILPIDALPGPLPASLPAPCLAGFIEAIRRIALTGPPITAYGHGLLIGTA